MSKRAGWLAALALMTATACTPPPAGEGRDPDGAALERLYARTAADIRARGGLRTGTAPADAPLDLATLTRNFQRIAFFTEFTRTPRGPVRKESPIPLTRWDGPVRIGVMFGASVAAAQRQADMAEIRALVARYRRLTGLDIRLADTGRVNFAVLVLARAEQLALADEILRAGGFPRSLAADLRNSPTGLLCSAAIYGATPRPGRIDLAVALIKAEHRGLMRRSCFHEELTQALGLLNDSPEVRPSVFNDDEEFALLTRQDEVMLRMLYDARLRPGMTAAAARPALPRIAADAARAEGLALE